LKNPKSILITGASSGIGEALALEYADTDVILHLSGRNKEQLSKVSSLCTAKGATVYDKIIDVTDEAEMHQWIDNLGPLDLVIANAGMCKSLKYHYELGRHTKEIFDVNVGGVFNTVHPAIEKMKERNKGQIALISSMAGYRGMPSAPIYSTSKVTVKAYGEALRGFYYNYGIEINVICPGFVRSRITDKNKFPMPFFMEGPKAAKIIRNGLEKNKGLIAFPWQIRLALGGVVRILPEFILERILRRLPNK
jgi:short-subunit dehydrogenase